MAAFWTKRFGAQFGLFAKFLSKRPALYTSADRLDMVLICEIANADLPVIGVLS